MLSVVDDVYNKSFTIFVDGTKTEVGWGSHSKKSIQCISRYIQEITKLFPEYRGVDHTIDLKEDICEFITAVHGEGTEDERIGRKFWSELIDNPCSQVGSILAGFTHRCGGR